MKWTCKDGRVLDIRDMDTQHLRNAVNMLRRKGAVTAYEFESCARYAFSSMSGDMASMAAENELMRMIPYKPLEVMERELEKRNVR